MKKIKLLLLGLMVSITTMVNSQTIKGGNYLSGSFNAQFSKQYSQGLTVRVGYHYYLTDHLAIGLLGSNWVDFLSPGIYNAHTFIGPSVKYHLPFFNYFFLEPSCLLHLSFTETDFANTIWGGMSLGFDLPINNRVFLEIAFTEQFTHLNNYTFSKELIDIGFSFLINKPKLCNRNLKWG